MYIVIMAGGVGQRFWPLSTPEKPKQCLELVGGVSLIQRTFQRALSLTKRDNILVMTGPRMQAAVREQLPGLPNENVIIEPSARNTAACIALAVFSVRSKGGEKILIWPADHHIEDMPSWNTACLSALEMAMESKSLALVGIVPDTPHTGYGHLCVSENGHRVSTFIEKPDKARAVELMASGNVLWNAGVCTGTVSAFIGCLDRHWHNGFTQIERYFNCGDVEAWSKVEKISFDYAVLEKMTDLSVSAYRGGWSDLGDWNAVGEQFPEIDGGRGLTALNFVHDGDGHVIYSPDKPVAILGLSDIVVIDTPNGLLVMHKDYAQDVRHASAAMEERDD